MLQDYRNLMVWHHHGPYVVTNCKLISITSAILLTYGVWWWWQVVLSHFYAKLNLCQVELRQSWGFDNFTPNQFIPYYQFGAGVRLVQFWHARRRCSQSPFRHPTGHDVSGPLFSPFFSFFFFSVVYVSHRRNAPIKNLVFRKMFGSPINLGLDPFPDAVCHFGF